MIVKKIKGIGTDAVFDIYSRGLMKGLQDDPRVCIYKRGAAADLFVLMFILPPGDYGPKKLEEIWGRSKRDLVFAIAELKERGFCEVIREPDDDPADIPVTLRVLDCGEEEIE